MGPVITGSRTSLEPVVDRERREHKVSDPNKTAPALAGAKGPGNTKISSRQKCNTERPPKKWQRVLRGMLNGRTYNRFEAERELHDHCLHSTVSALQSMGVTIHRRAETVPGFAGCMTVVTRYWLAPESHQMALELLVRANPCPEPPGTPLSLFDANAGA